MLDLASGSNSETLFGSLMGFHFIHCFTDLYVKTNGQFVTKLASFESRILPAIKPDSKGFFANSARF